MGLTQQREAVATIQEIVNLHLLGGHLGRPGAGLCPVRGHSNVQGDRTMGIWERPPSALLDKLRDTFGFEPPRNHGYDVVDSIKAMHRGDAKVFFAMGGNFLSATPDTEFTAQALANCNLTVHVSTKLNRSHLITGKQALILPCLGRTDRDTQSTGDQFVSVENSMGIVHSSLGKLRPPSVRLLSEPAIVARLAVATLGARSKISWLALIEDYDRIRDLIAKVIPGCEDYNRRVRLKSGFYLSNPARDSLFHTQTGKAHFSVSPLVPIRLEPGEFLLTTIRSHDQFNTTIYGLDDRYRGITGGRRVVFLNPDDIAEHGWRPGQHLDITSHFTQGTALAVPQAGDNSRASASEVSLRDAVPTNAAPAAHPAPEQLRTARHFQIVPYDIPRRCAATYFPEANVLVPINSVAKISNTPTSKSLRVTFSLSSP